MNIKKKPATLDSIFQTKVSNIEAREDSKELVDIDAKNRKRISLYLPEESHRRIKEFAARKGISITDVCLAGINIILTDNGEEEIRGVKA